MYLHHVVQNMERKWKQKSRKLAREMYWEKNDRNTYECPDCGRRESEIIGELEVHHKDGEPMDNRPENHVALCRYCHNLREDKKPDKKRSRQLQQQIMERGCGHDDNEIFRRVYDLFMYANGFEEHASHGKNGLEYYTPGLSPECEICGQNKRSMTSIHRTVLCGLCRDRYEWFEDDASGADAIDNMRQARMLSLELSDDIIRVRSVKDIQRRDVIHIVSEDLVTYTKYCVKGVDEETISVSDINEDVWRAKPGCVTRRLTECLPGFKKSVIELIREGKIVRPNRINRAEWLSGDSDE